MSLVEIWRFQRRFIADPSRFVVAMWARGNGKSAMTALKIVLDVFENEASNQPSDWLIVSASKEQAQEALGHVARWAKALYMIAAHLEIISEEVVEETEEGKQRYTRYFLRIGERTKVMAIATSPSAIRGYTANIWWDEACFFEDDWAMWQALQPCLRGRLRAIVTSTPMGGDEKFFHNIIYSDVEVRGKKLWSQHTCDIYQAIADGRNFDLAMDRAAMAIDAWAQEMELQWIDNKTTWFDLPLLQSCEDDRASLVGAGYLGGRCFVGNDIGRRGDKWVAWVLEEVGHELITREVVVLDKAKFAEHDEAIARLFEKYKIIRLCMDQSGIGERSTEEMIDLYGASRVEGVLFNTGNKEDMAVLGKKLLQEGRARLVDDVTTRRDLRRLQKTVSAGGAVRFNALRDKLGHADRCWAFLLACNAAAVPVVPVEFKSEKKPAEAFYGTERPSRSVGRSRLDGYRL